MVPHIKMTGQPYDISNLCQFSCYDWVYYRYIRVGGFPLPFLIVRKMIDTSGSYRNRNEPVGVEQQR